MASYMGMGGISPSRRLTELLSAYLDFDPSDEAGTSTSNAASAGGGGGDNTNNSKKKKGGGKRQFHLGLWGGDLSLHDVALRRDAIEPLLNELLMTGGAGHSDESLASSNNHRQGGAAAAAAAAATGTKRPRPRSNLDLAPFDPPPLQLTLIKGTIGHLRLAVPWKQLVLGGGGVSTTSSGGSGKSGSDSPVEMVVEDVTIVLGLKSGGGSSRDAKNDADSHSHKDSKLGSQDQKRGGGKGGNGEGASPDETARRSRKREETQRRIAEAERLHLCGLDIPAPDDHAAWGRDEEGRRVDGGGGGGGGGGGDVAGGGSGHGRLQGGGAAAAAVSLEANAGESPSSASASASASAGVIHRLLQSAKSSLVWRLVTHLRATIRNVRIVVIVDGVEVGLTIDSHDVDYWSDAEGGAGSDGGHGDGAETNNGNGGGGGGGDVAAVSTAGDAASEQHAGDGVNREVPSVVIRGPPGRIVRQQRTAPADASTAPLTVDSATLAPGDARRSSTTGIASQDESFGKIVKIRGLGVYVRPTTASTVRLMKQQQRQGLGRAGAGARARARARAGTVPTLPPLPRPFPDDYLIKPTTADVTVKLLRNAASASAAESIIEEQAPMQQDGGSSEEPPPKKRRGKRQKRARPCSAAVPSQEAHGVSSGNAIDVVPGANAEFTFGGGNDARVNSNERISSIAGGSATSSAPSTLLSGKPSGRTPQLVVGVRVGQIRTLCSTRQHALLHSFAHGATRIRNGRPEETIRSQLPRRSSADHRVGAPPRGAGLLGLPSAADRKSVVRAWWHYACGHVGRGVNRRLTMRDMFKAGPAIFDWDAQSHMREEYIAVYTKLRLGRRTLAAFPAGEDGADGTNAEHGIAPDQDELHSGEGLDEMLRIEDELSIEQILLYRSIARSAKIGGSSRVKVRGRPTSSLGRSVGGIGSRSTIARPTRLGLIDRRKTCSPALATPTRGTGTSSSSSISTPASSLKDYRIESKSSVQRKRHRHSHTSLDLSGIRSSLSGFNASDTNSNDGQSSRRSSAFDGDNDGIGRGDDQSLAVSLSRPSLHRSLSDRRMSSSVVTSQRGTTRTAMELAAVLEDVPLEELVQGEEQSAHTGLPRSVGELRESALMDGDDQTDASWRRVLEAVDAQAAAESTTNESASSGTALEFSLRFRFEGFSFALCSQVSAAGGISARSSMDHSWGGDSKDDVSVLTGYSSEGDDLVSSASFDPTNGLDRFGVDGLLSINGRLHRMVLAGGLDDIRLTVNGNSGGKKHCSFTLGSVNLTSQDSPEPLLSCDALNTEDRSMGGTEDTAIERPEDTSIFAGGSLVVKYVTGGDGDRIQLVEECRSQFARMHVFLHPVAFVDVSEFLSPPLGQLPFQDFGSHPYEEEYTKLVALAGGNADVSPNPQMQFSLSFEGMSISMPLSSGGLVIGQDPPLALFEFNSTQINSISTATAEIGDPSQQRQQRAGSLLDPRKIIDGLSSSSGFRHVMLSVVDASISFRSGPENSVVSLTRMPISCDIVLSSCLKTSAGDSALPKTAVSVQMSGVDLLMSTQRAELVASAIQTLGNYQTNHQSPSKSTSSLRPRIAKLSSSILTEAQLSCKFFCLTIESEDAQDRANKLSSLDAMRVKEILFEEIISDFISHLSCYDLLSPAEELINASVQLCVDRLTALGIEREAAVDCVLNSREIYLSDLQEMKAQMLKEVKTAGADKVDVGTNRAAAEGTAHHLDDDSAESFDIIETTMKNAVERTVLAAMPLLNSAPQSTLFDAFIVECPGAVDVTFSDFTYDSIVTFSAVSLEVKNGRGTHYLWITPPDKPGSSGSDLVGIHLSLCEQDAGDQIGDGGYSAYLLSDGDAAIRSSSSRSRERTIVMDIASADVVFVERDLTESVVAASSILDALESSTSTHHIDKDSEAGNPSAPSQSTVLAACIDSFSVLFASNEIVPFTRCEFLQVDIEAASASPTNNWANHLAFISRTFKMQDLTPEGQLYSDFIEPLEEIKGDATLPMLEITVVDPKDVWHQPMQVKGRMAGSRLVVLRRFFHEIMQYMFTTSIGGLGKFKAAHRTNFGVDERGNPPPPLQYRLEAVGSSILLPVDSQSRDLVAIEADKIVICNSYVKETWSGVDDAIEMSEEAPVGAAVRDGHSIGGGASRRSSSEIFFSPGSSSEEEFHDCVDAQIDKTESSIYEFVDDRISSHDNSWIERVQVAAEATQIYTSFVSVADSHEKVVGNRSFCLAPRRAKKGCAIFNSCKNGTGIGHQRSGLASQTELGNCIWREVTMSCVDLEITTDFVTDSLMRILLKDHLSTRSPDASRPFRMNMERAQLYTLLSIWYRNMQELPALFPFCENAILDHASAPPCPGDWPEYGTADFVDQMKSITSNSFEMVGYFLDVDWQCFLDKSSSAEAEYGKPTSLIASDVYLQMVTCADTTMRLACSATTFAIVDRCEDRCAFPHAFAVGERDGVSGETFASPRYFSAKGSHFFESTPHIDLSWGLDAGRQTLMQQDLPLPFQVTAFMTPDNWCLINLGVNGLDATSVDLSSVWSLLEYFSPYFQDERHGHPAFSAENQRLSALSTLLARSGKQGDGIQSKMGSATEAEADSCMNMDFRMWLLRPSLVIPSNGKSMRDPCLCVESGTGLYYRYKSIGEDFSTQEICSPGMSMVMTKDYMQPLEARGIRGVSGADIGVKTLAENLSFGVEYSYDTKSNHMNVSVQMPLVVSEIKGALKPMLGIEASDLQVQPLVLPQPKVCKPIITPTRYLGGKICDVYFSYDYLDLAAKQLLGFIRSPVDESNPSESTDRTSTVDTGSAAVIPSDVAKEDEEYTFSVCSRVNGFRAFLSDPILGMHHPIAAICVPSLVGTISRLPVSEDNAPNASLLARSVDANDLQAGLDLHFWVDYFKIASMRCWEPLIEPYKCILLYEKSSLRGQGVTFNADCPLHVNISGALLETIDDTINSFSSFRMGVFGKAKNRDHDLREMQRLSSMRLAAYEERNLFFEETVQGRRIMHHIPSPLAENDRVAFSLTNRTGERLRIHQSLGGSTASDQSVPTNPRTRITYVEDALSAKLEFPATISVVRNLQVIEESFENDGAMSAADTTKRGQHRSADGGSRIHIDASHTIDVQVPGFRWLRGMSVDAVGKRFYPLVPRSIDIREKLEDDWRLRNAVHVLADIGSSWSGGREVALSSAFTITNNTSHAVALAVHPNPRHNPAGTSFVGGVEDIQVDDSMTVDDAATNSISAETDIGAGESFQVPMMLLESSLHIRGNHLGSFWIRPEKDAEVDTLMHQATAPGTSGESTSIGYSSRPVQLAKLVQESATIYAKCMGRPGNSEPITPDTFNSGLQLSCPIVHENEEVSAAPFCYVVEIKRSPIIASKRGKVDQGDNFRGGMRDDEEDDGRVRFGAATVPFGPSEIPPSGSRPGSPGRRNRASQRYLNTEHEPIQYSLVIHPPLVIENLLPENGRFELMHATRRVVVWWADLKAGERIPVHAVGLDAPLLLLINLGFCRTPVGEGALVHHGASDMVDADKRGIIAVNQAGLQALGKAVTKTTQTVYKGATKTFTTIAEGESERGKGKVAALQSPTIPFREEGRVGNKKIASKKKLTVFGLDTDADAFDPIDAEGGSGDPGVTLGVEDIATETTVVDSLGQRLGLCIDNDLGSGGQRRVSIYCPFWIVNTTEHALRFKQEKSPLFVSGTVTSPTKDGSQPVDDSNRNYTNALMMTTSDGSGPLNPNRGTIFSGTPGALATACSGRSDGLSSKDLIELLNNEIPLERMAKMATMFNFHEKLSLGGQRRLCVQLHDGTGQTTYSSDWSPGFSLDSVGVTQVVGMHCKDRRSLEVSASIGVGPGRLAQYTKIVRFSPRSGADDDDQRLWFERKAEDEEDKPGRVEQYELLFGGKSAIDYRKSAREMPPDTNAHGGALFITTAAPSDIIPFHLPDTRVDRELRIDLGTRRWNLTSSFPADVAQEYQLKVSRSIDLRLLKHVTTRASSHYTVELPPRTLPGQQQEPWDGELGVWFETDWEDGRIVVKGTKRGKYSYNSTDIHVGDELRQINGEQVSRMSFEEVMATLKDAVAAVSADYRSQRYGMDDTNRANSALKPSKLLKTITGGTISISAGGSGQTSQIVSSSVSSMHHGRRLILTFRTVEERRMRIRTRALRANKSKKIHHRRGGITKEMSARNSRGSSSHGATASVAAIERRASNASTENREDVLLVDMKFLHQSIFVFVRDFDTSNPPYRIENRAINHAIYFRQRGCDGHPWKRLAPGESAAYVWEEPTKPKKLTVRVGTNLRSLHGVDGGNIQSKLPKKPGKTAARSQATGIKVLYPFSLIENEEEGGYGPTKTVRLEQIGFADYLPCPEGGVGIGDKSSGAPFDQEALLCRVDTEGGTRLLVISDATDKVAGEDEELMMRRHLQTLKEQIDEEHSRRDAFKSMKQRLAAVSMRSSSHSLGKSGLASIEESNEELLSSIPEDSDLEVPTSSNSEVPSANNVIGEQDIIEIADYPEGSCIAGCNQVLVEVLECTGLKASDLSGLSNPYAEVSLKQRHGRRKNLFHKRREKRKTYFIEKTLAPKWSQQPQIFVFDVPEEASRITRGYSIRVSIRSFKGLFSSAPFLGRTDVHLRSLVNQKESVGWYPLTGKTNQREVHATATSRVRGSVKLRVQWIYSNPALLDYYLLLSQTRLNELERSRVGMKQQLSTVIDSAQQRRQNMTMDALSLVRMPTITGIEGKRHRRNNSTTAKSMAPSKSLSSRSLALASPETSPQKPFRMTALRSSVKSARDKYLWALHAETAGLRSSRQHVSFDASVLSPSIERDRLGSYSRERGRTLTSSDSEGAPLSPHGSFSGDDFPDVQTQAPVLPQRGRINSLASQNDIFLKRMRAFSRGDMSVDANVLLSPGGRKLSEKLEVVLPTTEEELALPSDEAIRFDEANILYDSGLLYHESGSYFHRQHTTHQIRSHLSVAPTSPSLSAERASAKCLESIRYLRTWTLAEAYLNDPEIRAELTGEVSPKQSPAPKRGAEDFVASQGTQRIFLLPSSAPSSVLTKANNLAQSLAESRSIFARACNTSLKQVLNPGGWLTIRPITALNLPDTYAAMSVKLRYGSTVLVSQSADAKVTPRWLDENAILSPSSSSQRDAKSSPSHRHNSHRFVNSSEDDLDFSDPNSNRSAGFFGYPRENDLQVYVEPLKTSGVLRLSVVGEKLQSRVELGVLQINIAAALNCCVDAGEDDSGALQYIRWFPLMSPKDCTPIEGDMGYSTRPPESEKVSDNLFNQYFAPCIKLAIIWQPDSYNEAYETNLATSAVGSTHAFSRHSDDRSRHDGAEHDDQSVTTRTYIQGYADSISASLVDSARAKELLSFCSTDIDVRYSETKPKTRLGVAVGWIQLDHQLKAREPVCIAPTPVLHPQPTFQLLAVKDNLRSKVNIDSYEYIAAALQEIDVRIEEVWLFEVWEFLNRVLQRRDAKKRLHTAGVSSGGDSANQRGGLHAARYNFSDTVDSEQAENELRAHIQRGLEQRKDVDEQKMDDTKKLYIAQLLLGYVKLNLSYIKSVKGSRRDDLDYGAAGSDRADNPSDSATSGVATNVLTDLPGLALGKDTPITYANASGKRTDDGSVELYRRWSEGMYDYAVEDESKRVRNLPNLISTVFPAITGAPIRLQGKTIEHVFEGGSEIISSLRNYYVNEILRQVYKIIGSLDFVGNPTMVVSSFLTGVRDFFVQPSREFLRSPKDPSRIGIGVAKGTLSLVSHSASGVFGFASKMSATAGQAAAQLSFDKYYKQWHAEHAVSSDNYRSNRRTREIVVAGIVRPAQDVVSGVLFAASGVIVEPYRGYKEGRTVGLAKGVGIGAAGIITKPLVGIFDGFAHFTEAIHDLAKDINVLEKKFQPVQKRRLPYVFGTRDLLIHFDLVQATCMQLLRKFPPPSLFPGAEVIVHAEVLRKGPGTEFYVVVTTKRVAVFKARLEGGGPVVNSLEWQLLVHEGTAIKSSIESRGHNGIALYVMSSSLPGQLSGRRLSTELEMELLDDDLLPINHQQQQLVRSSSRTPSSSSFAVTSNLGYEDGFRDEDFTQRMNTERSFFATAQNKTKTAAKAIVQGAGAKFTLPRGGNQDSNVPRGESIRSTVRGPMIDQHMVHGEFQHRQALIRIHNAICCLARRFDLIMWEGGVGVPGSRDMYTTFGHLVFEEEDKVHHDAGRRRQDDESRPGDVSFDSISEGIAWLHDVDTAGVESDHRHLPVMSIVSRNEWSYADELDSSRREGGPNWWIEARARSTFVPPPSPPIPAHINPDDPVLARIMRRLEAGAVTYDQAVDDVRIRVAELEKARAEVVTEEEEQVGEFAASPPSDSDDNGSPEQLHTPPSATLHPPEVVSDQDGRYAGMMLTPPGANDTRSLQSVSHTHGSRSGPTDERIDRLVTTMERFLAVVAAGGQIGAPLPPPAQVPPAQPGPDGGGDDGNMDGDMTSVESGTASVVSTAFTNSSQVAFLMQEIAALRVQLQENRAEAAEQRQADEARHMREIETITRQFEQQAEELRAELNTSRADGEFSTIGVGAEVQHGDEDELETNVRDGGNVAEEGEFIEEDGGNNSDDDAVTDAGNFYSPDDINTSRRSLVFEEYRNKGGS